MTPETLHKIVISGIILILLALLGTGYFLYHHKLQLEEQQKAIETQVIAQKQLTDGIIRSQSSYASKSDIEAFAKANNTNLEAIRKDLSKMQATPTTITATTAYTPGYKQVAVKSTTVVQNANPAPVPTVVNGKETFPDPYGYVRNAQQMNLSEKINDTTFVPVGSATFSAWQQNPWDLTIYPRQYKIVSVIGTDNQQRNVVYNQFSISAEGKEYIVPISSSETKQLYPASQMYWWNPRLFIGFDAAYNFTNRQFDYSPNVSLALSSYGKFINSPDWSFFHVNVGYAGVSKSPTFSFTPAMYNVGKAFPLMSNTYVGPSFGIDLHGAYSILAGVKVNL